MPRNLYSKSLVMFSGKMPATKQDYTSLTEITDILNIYVYTEIIDI